MKKRRTRRYSDDEYDVDDNDGIDDGYRSEGHGRRSDAKRTHDGAVDDDYDLANGRPRRKRSKQRGRRDDDDRYGYKDGHRSSRKSMNGVEYGDGAIPPADRPPSVPSNTPSPMMGNPILGNPAAAYAAPVGAFAATQAFQQNGAYGSPRPSVASSNLSPTTNPAAGYTPTPQQPAAQSTSTLRGGMATGYVPYAHIYGGPTQPQTQPGIPPPISDTGSIQPTFMNQVAPPVAKQESYQQNPYAQDAPLGAQPGYMQDPYQHNRNRNWNRQYDGRYDDRSRHARYDSGSDSPPRQDRRRSRRSSQKSRRDRSPSEYSYSDDSRDDRKNDRKDDRRGRENRKQDAAVADPPPRSKSTLKGPFDTSQRGLGYSAVGALAGGLIGSEFAKGPVPRGIATALGAVAANVFQARERFVSTIIIPATNPPREQHATTD